MMDLANLAKPRHSAVGEVHQTTSPSPLSKRRGEVGGEPGMKKECPHCGEVLTFYPSAKNYYCPKKKGGCGRTYTSALREVGKNACRLCDAPTNTVHCRSCSKWVSACRRDGCGEEWRHSHVVAKVCRFHLCGRTFMDKDVPEGKGRVYCSDYCRRKQDRIDYASRRKANRSASKKARGQQGRISHDLVALQLLVMQRYECSLCGELIDVSLPHKDAMALTVDHTVPLIRGGSDDITNLTAAHRGCNSRKRDRV